MLWKAFDMIWQQHENIYKLQTPADFPFAFCINTNFSNSCELEIYAGKQIIQRGRFASTKIAQDHVRDWILMFAAASMSLAEQMKTLVE